MTDTPTPAPRSSEEGAPTMQFRKKPVVIEAVEWTGSTVSLAQIHELIGTHHSVQSYQWDDYVALVNRDGLKIFTLEGPHMASIGDWIIRGVKGECYPCKPDIFALTYEPTTRQSPPGGGEAATWDQINRVLNNSIAGAIKDAAGVHPEIANGGYVRSLLTRIHGAVRTVLRQHHWHHPTQCKHYNTSAWGETINKRSGDRVESGETPHEPFVGDESELPHHAAPLMRLMLPMTLANELFQLPEEYQEPADNVQDAPELHGLLVRVRRAFISAAHTPIPKATPSVACVPKEGKPEIPASAIYDPDGPVDLVDRKADGTWIAEVTMRGEGPVQRQREVVLLVLQSAISVAPETE